MSGRFVTAVFPSDDDDVITSPYNSVLAMKQLADHADCVLPVENQVGLIFCGKNDSLYIVVLWPFVSFLRINIQYK